MITIKSTLDRSPIAFMRSESPRTRPQEQHNEPKSERNQMQQVRNAESRLGQKLCPMRTVAGEPSNTRPESDRCARAAPGAEPTTRRVADRTPGTDGFSGAAHRRDFSRPVRSESGAGRPLGRA